MGGKVVEGKRELYCNLNSIYYNFLYQKWSIDEPCGRDESALRTVEINAINFTAAELREMKEFAITNNISNDLIEQIDNALHPKTAVPLFNPGEVPC